MRLDRPVEKQLITACRTPLDDHFDGVRAMPKRLSAQEFIDRSNAVHGYEYDYSKAVYRNSTSKVTISCKAHGDFDQVAGTHLKGHKCPRCAGKAPLSSEQWIVRAMAVHKNKYDYGRCIYVGPKCRVVVTCKDHGDFEQRAENHARGDGCPACSGNVKMTTDQFITKAEEVHGARYDYSAVIYEKNSKKVKIGCSKHGFFMQSPARHLYGQGCAHCAGRGSVSTEEFVRRAKDVHGDLYTYEKSEYINNSAPVCITCRTHGDFYQSPSNHVNGKTGCPECFGKHRHSKETWVALAVAVHGDKYGYSEVEYLNAKTKVKIRCGEHGYFFQTPNNHLASQGCQKCAGNIPISRDQWIDRAKEVHGDKYDYSEVAYSTSKTKVKVICKKHGPFYQEAGAHSRGYGCPKCIWDRDQPASVYLMKMKGLVKVGVSICPEVRLAQLNRRNPHSARLIKTWDMPNFPSAQQAEFAVHRALSEYSAGLSGFDGATEWFSVSPEHAAHVIKEIISRGARQLSLYLSA